MITASSMTGLRTQVIVKGNLRVLLHIPSDNTAPGVLLKSNSVDKKEASDNKLQREKMVHTI